MDYNSVATIRVYRHSFSCYCLRNTRNVAKIQENLTLQQFKVIDLGVSGKPICDFQLVINCLIVTVAISATVFEIFTLKDRKLLILPTLPCLTSHSGWPLSKFVMKFGIRKLESWSYHSEEIMTLAFFVLTQYRLVMDRWRDTLLSQRRASIASHG